MGGIQPQFGALFGPTKSICGVENLFAWDSALLRLSPICFVRQVEGGCLVMWNVRKLQVQIRAIVWRCSPEFLSLLFSTAPCSRRNSDEELPRG